MDEAVHNAILAVHLDETTREQWFELICNTYDEVAGTEQPTWERFAAELTERAVPAGFAGDTAEQFTRHLADTDPAPIDTIAKLRDQSVELPMLHAELSAGAQAHESSTPEYDEAEWQSFLAEHGPYWNGVDASWQEFSAWFTYQAEQRNLSAPATGFISYVEGSADKIAAFAEYGIRISSQERSGEAAEPAPDSSEFPEVKQGESGEWVAYLDAMLTSNGF